MRGGGREDDSKHDQIEFLFALAHGRNIDRRKAAGIARKEKKRERERWPLKSPKIFHRMGQDRYSRSATNHFEEVTNFSFSSSLPLSSSSYLHPLVALDLNSPSKEVSP